MNQRKIRVLIVDDSAIVRRVLSEILSREPDIEVAGTAPDPYVARTKIVELNPDVVTLDLEMPRMDGLSFLKRLMRYRPLPVIVISSIAPQGCETALQALCLGAVEVLQKPGGPYSVEDLGQKLAAIVRVAAAARVRKLGLAENPASVEPAPISIPALQGAVVLIGASTGGVEAVGRVLKRMPQDSPPTLIVQHIPPVFSAALAKHLNQSCPMEVTEAAPCEPLKPGRAILAPGNRHMELRTVQGQLCAVLSDAPPVNYHRPSIDILFHSAAKHLGRRAIGALLTGMGSDGAEGLLAMRQAGAATIVQNENTSAVYGMPAEAVRLGAAGSVLPIDEIAGGILGALRAARS